MFRVQNNVPEVYPDKSRDFQMFCRLFDVSFNSVKQSIDSLQYVTDTQACDARLLPLLKSKLGFFSNLDLSDTDIRYVLQAFPTIVRYKGSYQALVYVTNLYSRLVSSIATSEEVRILSNKEEYRIEVSSEKAVAKSELLFELLKYVLPTGYVIDYFITEYHDSATQLFTTNSLLYHVEYPDNTSKKAVIVLKPAITSAQQPEAAELPNIINITNIQEVSPDGTE